MVCLYTTISKVYIRNRFVMKNTDAIGSCVGNSYDPGRLKEIVDKIRSYKSISPEDVVALNIASSTQSEQKFAYQNALAKYHNKTTVIKSILDNVTAKLSQDLYVVNDVLNALIYELSEGRQITNAVQEQLAELLTSNSHPPLNAKIIVVLNLFWVYSPPLAA